MKIVFDVLIEIPKGSKNKYEFDKEKKMIRLDRVLHSSVVYPTDYGFVPNTLSLDGDPLDALVFLEEKTIPGCLIKVKPIGLFSMKDEKGEDEKIACVPISDPIYSFIEEIEEIPIHKRKEIEHFFSVYKDLEKKEVKIKGWSGKKEAINLYKKYIFLYKKRNII